MMCSMRIPLPAMPGSHRVGPTGSFVVAALLLAAGAVGAADKPAKAALLTPAQARE
jgi:hypothetical protein